MADIVTEAQLLATFSGGSPEQIAIQNLIHTLFSGVTPSSYNAQPTPTVANATGTLAIADLLTRIITCTSAAAVALTLPTGTLTDAGILAGALAIDGSINWTIINLGSSSGVVTVLAGVGHTLVGLATVAINTQAMFRTRKTAANTFVTYRIA
jgi:hypothetical protein